MEPHIKTRGRGILSPIKAVSSFWEFKMRKKRILRVGKVFFISNEPEISGGKDFSFPSKKFGKGRVLFSFFPPFQMASFRASSEKKEGNRRRFPKQKTRKRLSNLILFSRKNNVWEKSFFTLNLGYILKGLFLSSFLE